MSKILDVQKYVDEKNPQNLGDLFAHFKLDIESIIIASYLLGWDTKDLTEDLNKRSYTEDELLDKLDAYINHELLFKLLVPRTVHTSIILLINLQEKMKSKEIVLEVKDQDHYLSELEKHSLFDGPVIFFSSRIDLNNNYLVAIEKKITELDIHFQEPAYKEFFSHFELVPFLSADEDTQKEFIKLVDLYRHDVLYPVITTHRAEMKNNRIVYYFDNEFLKQSILGIDTGVNFQKLKENLLTKSKETIVDELGENVVKFAITQTWGLGGLDIGIKAVKILLTSLNESANPLSASQVNKDYVEFKDSGFDSVRDWFYNKIKDSLIKAMTESNLDTSAMTQENQDFLNNAYQNFIKRYFNMAALTEDPDMISKTSHTEIFLSVYDAVNNYKIRLNTGSL